MQFFWDPSREAFTLPFVGRPIAWYGVCFCIGFFLSYILFVALLKKRFFLNHAEATRLSDRAAFYVGIGVVFGARLGHLLFYEPWGMYTFWDIFVFWEGGLASHGAGIGIFLALGLVVYRFRVRRLPCSYLQLLDLVVIPVSLCGACIRIGNFFNQEILGTATTRPWGIVFGHPIDGSLPIARHPVQLYESLLYFLVAAGLSFLFYKKGQWKRPGTLSGVFFIFVFGFRFWVEFLKEEQSVYHCIGGLLMGQWLSLPFVLLGLLLLWRALLYQGRWNEG